MKNLSAIPLNLKKSFSLVLSLLLIIIAIWQLFFFLFQLDWDWYHLTYKFISFFLCISFIKISLSTKISIKFALSLLSLTNWIFFLKFWNQVGWTRWMVKRFFPIVIEVCDAEIFLFLPFIFIAVGSFFLFKNRIFKIHAMLFGLFVLFIGSLFSSYVFYFVLLGSDYNKIKNQESFEIVFTSIKTGNISENANNIIPIDLTHPRNIFVDENKNEIYLSLGSTWNFMYVYNPVLAKISSNNSHNIKVILGGGVKGLYTDLKSNFLYGIDWDLNCLYIISKTDFKVLHKLHIPQDLQEPIQLSVNETLGKVVILSTTNIFLNEYALPMINTENSTSDKNNLDRSHFIPTDNSSNDIASPPDKYLYLTKRIGSRFLDVLFHFPWFSRSSINGGINSLKFDGDLKLLRSLDFVREGFAKFGSQAYLLEANRQMSKYYVVLSDAPWSLVEIDARSLKVTKGIYLDDFPLAIALDEKNDSIFLSYGFTNKVVEIGINNFQKKNIYSVPTWIFRIVVDNKSNILCLLDYKLGKLYIMDRKKGKIVESYQVGDKPRGLYFAEDSNSLYILSSFGVMKLRLQRYNNSNN